MTEWVRDVVGYEGLYKVTELGVVLSKRRSGSAGGPLRPKVDKDGYLRVDLSNGNVRKTFPVHRLVLDAFVGPRPDGMEARHRNGKADDNRAVNLAWGTKSENERDRVEHGTHSYAAKTHCPQNHEYTEVNTYRTKRGDRRCRICNRDRQRRRRGQPIPGQSRIGDMVELLPTVTVKPRTKE